MPPIHNLLPHRSDSQSLISSKIIARNRLDGDHMSEAESAVPSHVISRHPILAIIMSNKSVHDDDEVESGSRKADKNLFHNIPDTELINNSVSKNRINYLVGKFHHSNVILKPHPSIDGELVRSKRARQMSMSLSLNVLRDMKPPADDYLQRHRAPLTRETTERAAKTEWTDFGRLVTWLTGLETNFEAMMVRF